MAGGRHGVVVVLEGQSLKGHILQIRRYQQLRELRNDHSVGIRVLAGVGQVGQRPGVWSGPETIGPASVSWSSTFSTRYRFPAMKPHLAGLV